MASDEVGHVLPTDRIPVHEQFRVLHDVTRLSGQNLQTVQIGRICDLVGMRGSTVTETLTFAVSLDLMASEKRGFYASTEAGWTLSQLWDEDEAHARLFLRQQFVPHWSVTITESALSAGPMSYNQLAHRLSRAPQRERRGRYLVDWLSMGLILHHNRRTAQVSLLGHRITDIDSVEIQDPPDMRSNLPALGLTVSELRTLSHSEYQTVLDALDITHRRTDRSASG